MTTASLKNLPFLDRVERSGISTAKLTLILLATGALVGLTASGLAFYAQWRDKLDKLDPWLVPILICLCIFLGFCFTAMAVFMARSTEADVRELSKADPGIAGLYEDTVLSKAVVLALLVFNVLVYFTAFLVVESLLFPDRSLLERFDVITSFLPPSILYFLAIPILGIGATPLNVVILQQPMGLAKIARQVEINVFNLAQYQHISNPFVRSAIGYGIIATMLPLAVMPIDDIPSTMVPSGLAAVAIMVIITSVYLIPVVILRNRIRDRLQAELAAMGTAMSQSDRPDEKLLTRQMYLESRLTWPLANNVQKILAVGFLPPMAWILAAAVENLIF